MYPVFLKRKHYDQKMPLDNLPIWDWTSWKCGHPSWWLRKYDANLRILQILQFAFKSKTRANPHWLKLTWKSIEFRRAFRSLAAHKVGRESERENVMRRKNCVSKFKFSRIEILSIWRWWFEWQLTQLISSTIWRGNKMRRGELVDHHFFIVGQSPHCCCFNSIDTHWGDELLGFLESQKSIPIDAHWKHRLVRLDDQWSSMR